jgi:PKD repeat protein
LRQAQSPETPFQINAGGEGESTVTAQAADLAGSVGADAGTVTLYNVTFEGGVARNELSLTVNELEGDNGDTISGDLVSVQLANPFPDGVPGISGDPPADPDGDGLYEDINADGTADFDDAVDLAFADTDDLSQAQTNALDFNGDGAVDFGDAIELAFDT